MRPLLIFGASRGVGLELAKLERGVGRPVCAMLRTDCQREAREALDSLGVQVTIGDALNPEDVARAFRAAGGGDVVSTIGGQADDGRCADDEGNIALIEEAEKVGAAGRFVLVTSIGCGEMAPYRSPQAIAAFGTAVDAKTRAEERLRGSSLKWTILRPGGLVSKPATDRGVLSEDREMHGFIHRADVAALVLRTLRDPATVGRAFAAVDSAQARSVHPLQPFPLAPA